MTIPEMNKWLRIQAFEPNIPEIDLLYPLLPMLFFSELQSSHWYNEDN